MPSNFDLERQQARERGVDFGRAEIARFTKERGRVDSSGRLATPLLREAVRAILRASTDGDTGLKKKLDAFRERISFTLSQRGGRPSNFAKLWAELEFDQDDAEMLFFLTLHEMLHAILSALSGVTLDTEEQEEDSDARAPLNYNEATSRGSKVSSLLPEDVPWLPQQTLYQRVWEAIALELALRRGMSEEKAASVARKLQDTSPQRRRQRQGLRRAISEEASAKEGIPIEDRLSFAAELVQLVMEDFNPPWFDLRQIGGRRSFVCLIATIPLMEQIRNLANQTRLIDRNAPLLVRPKEWSKDGGGVWRGGYHFRPLEFYKFWHKNGRIQDFLSVCDKSELEETFTAVNALQNTPWRINKRVWGVVSKLHQLTVATFDKEQKDEMVTLLADFQSGWEEWIRKSFWKNRKGPGYRLSTAMTFKTVTSLCEEERFFFAHQVDSRGRIYPVTGWLSPQGEDLARGLLEFAIFKPLTEAGVPYLAIHGSQMVPRETILADLAINDRLLPDLDERIRWVTEHVQDIKRSAEDPLKETWWRDVAKKNPFQFLAFCFAWYDYLRVGATAECSLPIQHDGTCNGLQHIAALTGDEALAGSTNLLPGDPRDIYIKIARWVKDQIELNETEEPLATFVSGLQEFVDRDMAKKVVMIIPYGAGRETYQRTIAGYLREVANSSEDIRSASLRKLIERNELTLRLASNRFSALATAIESRSVKQGKRYSRKKAVYRTTDPLSLLAHYLAVLFDNAIAAKYPVINQFKEWLHKTVLPVVERNLPVMWIAPSGLPILQRNFKLDSVEKETKLFGRLRFTVLRTTDNVAERSQLTGILPNFIHCMDSAHLIKTVLSAKKKKVTCFSMVHDSFGTHAVDMDNLAKSIREAFVDLYSEDILERFSRWIDAVIFGADHRTQTLLTRNFGGYSPTPGEQPLLELASRWSLSLDTQVEADPRGKSNTRTRSTKEPPSVPYADGFDIQKVLESEYFFH